MALKGIVLAGGSGTRLHPLTIAVSKQLMPVFDKPMIYYPLSTLMFAGARDVLIISTPEHIEGFRLLLGDGSKLGMAISYAIQPRPDGLARAFVIGADFVGADPSVLVLGDNLFYGHQFPQMVLNAAHSNMGATIFGYYVLDPQRYGVVELDRSGRAIGLEEKPSEPRSHYAVPGLYFYDNSVIQIARELAPSLRGEYEITDVNRHYLERGALQVKLLGRGTAWLDTGTPESLLQASNYVEVVQQRQGLRIAAIEEVAFRMRFIDRGQLLALAEPLLHTEYGRYLTVVAEEDREW